MILFRALYLGGYDITKDHFDIEHASLTTRFIAAQVQIGDVTVCMCMCMCDICALYFYILGVDILPSAGQHTGKMCTFV